MEVSGQIHVHDPAALPPGKGHLVPNGLEAGWAPEPVWTRWWRDIFPAPAGTRTPDHPDRNTALCFVWPSCQNILFQETYEKLQNFP